MKQLFLFSALALSIITNAQSSFYKGAIVADVRTGFEIYNTKLSLTNMNNNTSRDTVQTDKAGTSYFAFSSEYGLHKMFGVGFGINKHKFISETDSATGQKPDMRSTDINLVLNFHAVSTKRFDMVLGTEVGYSSFRFASNDKVNTILTGKGGMFAAFYANPRIYFGPVGINFRLYTPMFSYKKIESNNVDFNKYNKLNQFKGSSAFGISAGIQYRFMKDKSSGASSGASH
jgi:hypothetical protein